MGDNIFIAQPIITVVFSLSFRFFPWGDFFFASCLGNTHKYDIYHLSLFTLFDFSILWDSLLATFSGYHLFCSTLVSLLALFWYSLALFWITRASFGLPLDDSGAQVDSLDDRLAFSWYLATLVPRSIPLMTVWLSLGFLWVALAGRNKFNRTPFAGVETQTLVPGTWLAFANTKAGRYMPVPTTACAFLWTHWFDIWGSFVLKWRMW